MIMDTCRKVKLSGSKSMIIDAFVQSAPRPLFKGSGITALTHKTYLPALYTKEYWENSHRMGGLKSKL